jgi:hypothetical protein
MFCALTATGIFVKKLAKDTLNTAKKKQKKDRSRALNIIFYKPIISIKLINVGDKFQSDAIKKPKKQKVI